MSHWEVFCHRVYHLSIAFGLAVGLYGCSTGAVADREADGQGSVSSVAGGAGAQATAEMSATQQASPAAMTQTAEGSFKMENLRVVEGGGQTTVVAKFSDAVTQYRHYTLALPARIVLDVFAAVQPMASEENFRVSTGWINGLRLSTTPGQVRLVVEVASGAVPEYVVEPEEDGLKIVVGSVNPKATAKKDLLLLQSGKRMLATTVSMGEQAAGGEGGSSQQRTFMRGGKKDYTGQKISLDFKDADIKNVFRLLAEVSGLNIVVTEDVVKKVTVRLVDIPWDQAMDILLETNGLGKEQVGNVVRISSVQRLRSERDAIRAAQEAEKKIEPLQTAYITVNYAKASDIVEKIRTAKILSERGEALADDRTNTIFLRDIQHSVEEANDIVARLDARTPQVLIESNIIETTPSFARALGSQLEFAASLKDAPSRTLGFNSEAPAQSPFAPASSANPLGLTFSLIADRWGSFRDVTTALTAAEKEGNIRIISRPSVVTLNNIASTIQSLRIVRISLPTGTTNIASGTGSAAGAAVATESVNVGIILTVTPQVSSDGFVLLNISVKSSSLGTQTTGGVIPDELSREAISNVLVRDGETVVIGGIMKDTREESESGVPYLKDIPIFGWFFKQFRVSQDYEELMVFITPRTVMGGAADLPKAEQLWRKAFRATEGDRSMIPPGPVGP